MLQSVDLCLPSASLTTYQDRVEGRPVVGHCFSFVVRAGLAITTNVSRLCV